MANLSKHHWLQAEKSIGELLTKFPKHLDLETIRFVKECLTHREYEMAFEGLFIELIDAEIVLSEAEKERYFTLGQDLGLNIESVFDDGFWNAFSKFVNER